MNYRCKYVSYATNDDNEWCVYMTRGLVSQSIALQRAIWRQTNALMKCVCIGMTSLMTSNGVKVAGSRRRCPGVRVYRWMVNTQGELYTKPCSYLTLLWPVLISRNWWWQLECCDCFRGSLYLHPLWRTWLNLHRRVAESHFHRL